MKKSLFITIILITLCFISSCRFFTSEEKKVEKSYNEFLSAISNKNYEEIWNLLAYENQKQYEEFTYKPFNDMVKRIPQDQKQKKIPNTNITIEEMEKMPPKEFFIYQLSDPEIRDSMLKSLVPERKIEKVTIEADKATLKMEKWDDKTISDKIHMKLEDNRWRIVLWQPGELKY